MRAAWYEQQGAASEVLVVGEMTAPSPAPGEVRIRVAASGVNPGEVKKRSDAFGIGMPYPRVIPHSDGAGTIEAVGEGVDPARIGQRVWCFGAQSERPFGTAAEFVAVPSTQAWPLPEGVSFEVGACLGIPGITGHRAVFVAGPVKDRIVLVQGGAGAVGQCAVAMARHGGANVIATVRTEADAAQARAAGAHVVLRTDNASSDEVVELVLAQAPGGIDHVVEVAFDANVFVDERVLRQGGSIAAYATRAAEPTIPFWLLVFKNVRIDFLGSDDFPAEAKRAAASDLNAALASGWPGPRIDARYALDEIAAAHIAVEQRSVSGRVVVHLESGGG
ncbi:MAG: NADPH:quinone reductase [Planctomycetes bacterium]|nr:NADPH:quinone reductase [Planctomycetota bacterium]